MTLETGRCQTGQGRVKVGGESQRGVTEGAEHQGKRAREWLGRVERAREGMVGWGRRGEGLLGVRKDGGGQEGVGRVDCLVRLKKAGL